MKTVKSREENGAKDVDAVLDAETDQQTLCNLE